MKNNEPIKILGLTFFKGKVQDVVESLKSGGLLVVPAAPGLITIEEDRLYYESLLSADITIPDSGYMTLMWNIVHKKKINKISGLKFLNAFIADQEIKDTSQILLVNPRLSEATSNLAYLRANGFIIEEDKSYIAPVYDKKNVHDEILLQIIEERKPKFIIVNLGGGVQEKLGSYLKKNLSYVPAIICTGAAISFLTGEQATIPNWADRFYLGWLLRCINNPSQFVPRYFRSFKLIVLMAKHSKHLKLNHYLKKIKSKRKHSF